ncbi:hypothetical protein PENSPDRAFT_569957 [Peniophora sp. CONT]|nr:hypothetical protein PENSPDRAFT_569957 [Peniophora sp. CONT]
MENERNKHKPFWGPPRRASDRCLTYGTREYTAKLYNILTTETWADKCANTSIEIKGRTHARPIRCQDYGSDRGIYGYWLVNYDEPECKPIWDQFWKKGCDHLPGHRRWESILSNTYSNSDMPEVCRSTPGTLPSGEHFTTSTCIGSWRGWIGQWDVPDSSCAWE